MQFPKLVNVLIVNVLLSRRIPVEDLKERNALGEKSIDVRLAGIIEVMMGRDVRLCDSCRDSTCRLACDRSAVCSRYILSCTR